MRSFLENPPVLLALLLIAGFAFALRVSGIEYGLPSKSMTLTTYHPDESIPIYTMAAWKPSKFYFHPGRIINWGGFHLFPMAASLKAAQIVGYLKPGSREFYENNLDQADKIYKITRMLQIVTGTLTVFAGFWIIKKCFGLASGVLTSVLIAICPALVINSFSTRPDVSMVFVVLCSLIPSIQVWNQSNKRYSIYAGILLGLATATKYSAAPYGIFHVLIHLLSPDTTNRKNLAYFLGAGAIAFAAGCPYLILDFPWFYEQALVLVSLAKAEIAPVIQGPGWKLYLTYFLPHGIGWPLTAAGFAGWLWMIGDAIRGKVFFRSFQNPSRFALVWIASAFIIYMVVSATKSQQVHYTQPVVPLFIFFAAYMLGQWISSLQPAKKWAGVLAGAAVVSYTLVYSLAHLKLYAGVNVREEASVWVDANIPKTATIGIARSFFWTPGILRQYHPPYRVLKGGGDTSFLNDAILNLPEVAKKADYFVLTEYEYRSFLLPQFHESDRGQDAILRQIMEKDFTEVKRFDREAQFLSFKFRKKEDDPFDWIMPNPTIRVFKKIKRTL